MAKEAAEVLDRGEEYVDFTLPLSGPDSKPVFVGVNGEAIMIRPGETVQIKRKFVEALMNSMKQEREAWETQLRAQNAAKRALAEL